LKRRSIEVNDLHREIDKENAMNINSRLSILIKTLLEMESNRRESQNSLENALGDWSAKVKLFEDEASRKS